MGGEATRKQRDSGSGTRVGETLTQGTSDTKEGFNAPDEAKVPATGKEVRLVGKQWVEGESARVQEPE